MIKRLSLWGVLFLCISVWLLPEDISCQTLSEDEQLIAVGVGAFNDGLYDIAEKNLSDFVKSYPQHKKFYDVSYLLARTHLMNGKWREAKTSFSRILQDNKFANLDYVLFWLGEIEARLGRPEEGRKAFLSLVQRFPKFTGMDEAYYALGLFDLGNGQWTTAESFFKKASQVSKNQTLIQSSTFWLGVSSFKRGDYGTAISLFQTLAQPLSLPYPSEFPKYALIWLGDAQVRLNQFAEAKSSYQTFLNQFKSDPLLPEIYWKMGLCEYRTGNIREASKVLQEFKHQPKGSRVLLNTPYLLGEISFLLGDYSSAIKEWGLILENAQATTLWAVSLVGQFWNYIHLGEAEEANRAFQKLIKLSQADEEQQFAQWLYGELFFVEGKVPDALPYYFNILNTKFREKALFQIGKGYFFEQKFRESITNLDILFLEFPSSRYFEEGLFIKAESLVRLDDLDRALETYTLMTRNKRTSTWQLMALIQMGDLYLLRRENAKAEQTFKQTMTASPDHPLAYYSAFQLGNLQVREKNWGEAIHYYSLVLRANISEWLGEAYFRLGEVFYQQEKYEPAFANFETAMGYLTENSPWFFLTHLELGNLQRRWERYDEAKQSYKTILDHSKDEDLRNAARELLNRIDSSGRGRTS
jgi:TolA-binding protein